jgi:hypothetical protein
MYATRPSKPATTRSAERIPSTSAWPSTSSSGSGTSDEVEEVEDSTTAVVTVTTTTPAGGTEEEVEDTNQSYVKHNTLGKKRPNFWEQFSPKF